VGEVLEIYNRVMEQSGGTLEFRSCTAAYDLWR